MRSGEPTAVVPGAERLFEQLPPRDGVWNAAWSEHHRGNQRMPLVDFGIANLIRVWGADWREHWSELTRARMRDWGFNTIANWSDDEFERGAEMPYVASVRFPSTQTLLFRDLPDVFDPTYERSAAQNAESLRATRDDPFLLGYFLGNEPHWAFGAHNLASEMLESNPGTHSRRALTAWLRERYNNDVAAWSKAWSHSFAAFKQIDTEVFHRLNESSKAAQDDLWEFSRVLARRWASVPCEAMRRVDTNHLNLGVRYAWVSSDLCLEGGALFDVFTLNNYSMKAPVTDAARVAEATRRPVLIGEFHFGAADRGLPASGLRRVPSQTDRGVAYRRYVEACAADSNIVGAHYFQWNDQGVLGRYDGENYNIGFVDACHTPYAELVEAARQTHERVFELRTHQIIPFAPEIRELPRLY